MRPADRLHSLLSESRPFLYFHAPRFNEFPFVHFSTNKRGLVYSSIIFLRAFFVQSRVEHFWKRVLSDSRGKDSDWSHSVSRGTLIGSMGILGIYYAEWFQWRWWNQVWKWRNCGVESKSESRIFKRIMSFHYTFAWLLNYYNVGRKFESILVYLSREKKISRSIPSKTRRILLKIVFPRSTI